MKLKDTCSLEEKLWPTWPHIKKQRHYLAKKGPSSQGYGFSSSHVWMWELDHKESWTLKNWCFWTVLLEKTLESPLDCKDIKPVNPKGNQSWIWKDRCWSWNSNSLANWCEELTYWKRLWCWERLKAGGEGDNREWDIEWHHRLYAHEFESTPGVGDEQGSLVYCSPWGWKELNTTEQLNWTELRVISGHGIDFHFLVMNCEHDFIHCISPIGKFWAKKTVKLGRWRSWTKTGPQRSPELYYSG